MSKKILTTPISAKDLEGIKVGDGVYLTGRLITCRDVAHRRLIEQGIPLPIDVRDMAILHAGPIVREAADGSFSMVSIGPTTSMRMEKFEKEFIRQTGVRLVIGKGGMGKNTEEACREYGAMHLVYPAGNAVLAALQVKRIADAKWQELGMPETLWVCDVEAFGPLIVSIDAEGNNLFEINKLVYKQRKEEVYQDIIQHVHYGYL